LQTPTEVRTEDLEADMTRNHQHQPHGVVDVTEVGRIALREIIGMSVEV
jgi:hypothetical protein